MASSLACGIYLRFVSRKVIPSFTVLNKPLSQDVGPKKQSGKKKEVKPPEQNILQDISNYKVPEYYQHNEWSFLDLMVDMDNYRCPQPSNKEPLVKK